MQQILRHFESDGLAAIVDLGFVPDLTKVHLSDGTNVDIITQFRRMFDDEGEYGTIMTGATGVTTVAATAATGVSAYDETLVRQMLPAPSGDGLQASAMAEAYTVARSTAATARSTTALGTILKPSIASGNTDGLVFECTTAGTGSAEPTWPTRAGESVTDGTTVFIARDSNIKDIGVKGIQIGADVINNDDGNQIYVEAYRADRDPADLDAGSIVAGNPI